MQAAGASGPRPPFPSTILCRLQRPGGHTETCFLGSGWCCASSVSPHAQCSVAEGGLQGSCKVSLSPRPSALQPFLWHLSCRTARVSRGGCSIDFRLQTTARPVFFPTLNWLPKCKDGAMAHRSGLLASLETWQVRQSWAALLPAGSAGAALGDTLPWMTSSWGSDAPAWPLKASEFVTCGGGESCRGDKTRKQQDGKLFPF